MFFAKVNEKVSVEDANTFIVLGGIREKPKKTLTTSRITRGKTERFMLLALSFNGFYSQFNFYISY